MAKLFISHSSENNAEAVAVSNWLATTGWNDVFLDLDPQHGLKPGEQWQKELKTAAERCEVVLFLISPEWAASRWCIAEFLLAKNLNKQLIGVLIKQTPFEDLPVEMTSEWQIADLTTEPRAATFDVSLPHTGEAATVAFSSDGLERLRIGLQAAGLDARYFAWPPEHDPDRPPYRGLKPLEAEDAGIFFGRDGTIVNVLGRLRGLRASQAPRILVILGASGSGKSSLLRAGILPRLERDDRHFLPLTVIRPGQAAITGETGLLASLTATFRAHGVARKRAVLREAVEGGGATLKPLLRELVQVAGRSGREASALPPTLVLAIDQGEELYSPEAAGETEMFLDLLRDLLTGDDPAVAVLFTIRSDSYEPLQSDMRLEGLRQETHSLAPMPSGAYKDVITGPASRLEGSRRPLKIGDRLTDALLEDIEDGGTRDALPLLSFTLERLYAEYGDDGDITLADYEQMGRISGSIEAAVESALKSADSDPRIPRDRQARLVLLRRGLIPWLAGIDPETKKPRRHRAYQSAIPEEARPLIMHLVEQRLLATDIEKETGTQVIEPAHEALLRQWGLLDDWLGGDAEALTVLAGVKRAARDWDANARTPAWLDHTEGRLKAVENITARKDLWDYLELNDQAYVKAARQAENSRHASRRRTRAGLMVAGFIAAIAIGFAVYTKLEQRWTEELEKQTVLEASRLDAERRSIQLAGFSAAALQSGNATLAVLLGLEGIEGAGGQAANIARGEMAVRRGLQNLRERTVLRCDDPESGKGARFNHVAINSSGTMIAGVAEDGVVCLWNRETGNLSRFVGHEPLEVYSIEFSPDGKRLVSGSNDKSARIWNTASIGSGSIAPERVIPDSSTLDDAQGCAGRSAIRYAEFNHQGDRIVVARADGYACVYALTGKIVAEFRGSGDGLRHASFDMSGQQVATASQDKHVRVWTLDGQGGATLIADHTDGQWIRMARFDISGRQILFATDLDVARVLEIQSGSIDVDLKGHSADVFAAKFSSNGEHVVTSSVDDTARLWSRDGRNIAVLAGHRGNVYHATFDATGEFILTASNDGTVRVWNRHPVSSGDDMVTKFPSTEALVTFARHNVARCLTPGERIRYALPSDVPSWCERLN